MKVSIVMPAYNAEKTISNSIYSVVHQTYKNWELLVIDDSSNDATSSIVQEFQKNDIRIRYIKNEGKRGVSSARNVGISLASGVYIAFLDSDDTWENKKLELQIDAMQKGSFNVSHTSYNKVSLSGVLIGHVRAKRLVTYKDMLKYNHIGNLTGIYNVGVIGKVYQNGIGHEDYDMWLRVLSKSDSIGVDVSLANYLVQSGSLSSNKFLSASWHFNILKRECGDNIFKVVFYFLHYIFNAIKIRRKFL
ncbi:TPA: glycosyltransferase family 2 protein [Vibrio cholerae]|nr:glycosyltransferase family 2 protein [Vibrio cholerae]BCN20070.1 putative glycosyltransferase [Vibrio cholerae]GHZ12215.1 glycosyl transferase [Vibrio cholerae]